jgi:hypothetical protein
VNTIPKDPDPRNLYYLEFVQLQRYGPTKDEIAHRFRRDSAEAVFEELKGYGFPVCEVCGANPTVGRHCPKDKPKVRQMGGDPKELPSIEDAATTFRDTMRTLEDYLEHALSLKESLQGRYFVGEGETEDNNIREVRGAQWHPHPYVVILIAASILEHQGNWGFVEHLLHKLHPRPSEANRQQLVRFIYGKKVDERGRPILKKNGQPIDSAGDGLLDRAKQVAALIRGKEAILRGRKGPDVPSWEQYAILYIRSLVDKGLSREEIARRELEEFERWKEGRVQSLREELEQTTLDQDEVTELEDEISRTEAEEHNEGEINRLYNLAKDLR